MKSILNALQDGRLIELPETDKAKALEYLAVLIEAVPDIGPGTDIVGDVMRREAQANTGLGMGVACPHVRRQNEGELLCAVGWSPKGIDYGAIDGQKVHLVIMYFIPDSQKAVYLKEVSGLAKAIMASKGITSIASAADIGTIRNQLLDWVALAIGTTAADTKARMIQLEVRTAAIAAQQAQKPFTILPLTVVVDGSRGFMVLAQNQELVAALEKTKDLPALLHRQDPIQAAGYIIALRAASTFVNDRVLNECVAVKAG